MTALVRSVLIATSLAGLAAACAPKTAPVVPSAPKYSSFVFPAVPQSLGAPPLSTKHAEAWQRLQNGDLRGAERDFRWVTSRNPTYFPSETGLGYVALARKDFKQALQHFELALAESPRYASALVGRGDALLGGGRTMDAIDTYEAALSADPSLTELRGRIDALRFKGLEDQVAFARKARDAGHLDDAAAAYQRAIAASPESGFLLRELAAVEQRTGNLDAALEHARKAASVDPYDARAHVLAGEILESQHDYKQAITEYRAAAAIEPSDELTTRIDAAQERADVAAMPAEFHTISADPSISRAALAALIGVHLDELLRRAPGRAPPVMTDTRASWAARWIAAVVGAGVMDPFPNHTFQPADVVRRSDLALAVSRLLPLAAVDQPQVLTRWSEARPRIADLPPGNLVYPAAALAIEAGVLKLDPDGSFDPGRPVSGAEAIAAIDQVETIWRGKR